MRIVASSISGGSPSRLRPEQRDRLGRVADIVAAHMEQHRVDPLLGEAADRGALDVRNVERAGQRREPDSPGRDRAFP